ncbi:hypothetical protein AWB77_06831 [Caballeronia fortuita]|uniref:Uncharacterized protein n=1 Tax=Caballeronia fortuita TaxID=1777138 RepID=A0A158E9S9_9BURK|nr:hypothetical protein AWB77_06831 [Caballeronia fortuita]
MRRFIGRAPLGANCRFNGTFNLPSVFHDEVANVSAEKFDLFVRDMMAPGNKEDASNDSRYTTAETLYLI